MKNENLEHSRIEHFNLKDKIWSAPDLEFNTDKKDPGVLQLLKFYIERKFSGALQILVLESIFSRGAGGVFTDPFFCMNFLIRVKLALLSCIFYLETFRKKKVSTF